MWNCFFYLFICFIAFIKTECVRWTMFTVEYFIPVILYADKTSKYVRCYVVSNYSEQSVINFSLPKPGYEKGIT